MFELPPAVTDSWFSRWVEVNLLLPKWLNCSCTYFPSKIRRWGEKFRIRVDRNIAAMPQHSCSKQQGPQLWKHPDRTSVVSFGTFLECSCCRMADPRFVDSTHGPIKLLYFHTPLYQFIKENDEYSIRKDKCTTNICISLKNYIWYELFKLQCNKGPGMYMYITLWIINIHVSVFCGVHARIICEIFVIV